ncbi:TBC1 DOMAIN FAMILY MEMBER GTPASE-ACTIVATING PROTEIN, putative [Babesia bigemina]|uniref:TBC1 DOMAIN FAMILY MEMBER GTPASE-ACTIVATING PROTEIN, putative n=1 Tax=Babesia bigemina TaxID=5866 RepID=A0A061DDT2_BABBI|nr:TBC1 DOMAIN FAMILY MEMBER GTPASE-ACTIVATING PROTEIN, putative [Babesia bigemina]CDR96550.1 TBC1 DOMAIN FAMILY MEMBER GTPASE-ACTIVATING PROTEIN, putative [Babesia bigemina]|eukprot:XP_012768736.1 TBC1 DOMAIN FAMILY MEMBER GTPASE-ACTIVATING PROTEIN, putative [Babesia bigemina]
MINSKLWEEERKSSLFNRSGVHSEDDLLSLRRKVEALVGRNECAGEDDILSSIMNYVCKLMSACNWWSSSPSSDEPLWPGEPRFEVSEENERIFRLDAERTFISEENRAVLCRNLTLVFRHVGDYHQGEGFVIAFLSLFLPAAEVVRLVVHLHENQLRGYFSCTPEAYVRDSRVLMRLLKGRNEELCKHLEGLLVPETFCSKWFIGMNVHVLPFEYVVKYIDKVLSEGERYIFSFGLAFLLFHAETILGCNDVSKVLQLLRLDDAILPPENEREAIYSGIMKLADETAVDIEQLSSLRAEVEKELQEQKEARERRMKELEGSDDEIVFSDEE